MATSTAKTVTAYVSSLAPAQRESVERVRALVKRALPKGFEEVMQYGMISWIVPPARLDKTYNNQPLAICALAAQKNYLALYLMGLYTSGPARARFEAAYKASGKKLDMGKSCLRFKQVSDLAEPVVAEALGALGVDDFVALYERTRGAHKAGRAKKPTAKKKAAKKAAKKKPAKKAAKKKPAKTSRR